jgi:hypothetical protein
MEPEVREFLQRIVWTLSVALLWLMINTIAGLRFELAIIDGKHTIATVFFYTWLLASLFLMLRLFRKWWKAHL